jgi:hypothetical protein
MIAPFLDVLTRLTTVERSVLVSIGLDSGIPRWAQRLSDLADWDSRLDNSPEVVASVEPEAVWEFSSGLRWGSTVDHQPEADIPPPALL